MWKLLAHVHPLTLYVMKLMMLRLVILLSDVLEHLQGIWGEFPDVVEGLTQIHTWMKCVQMEQPVV